MCVPRTALQRYQSVLQNAYHLGKAFHKGPSARTHTVPGPDLVPYTTCSDFPTQAHTPATVDANESPHSCRRRLAHIERCASDRKHVETLCMGPTARTRIHIPLTLVGPYTQAMASQRGQAVIKQDPLGRTNSHTTAA